MKPARFVLFVLLACTTLVAGAQKPVDLKRDGDKYFANGHWAEANKAYQAYQAAKPGDTEVLKKLGISAYHLHQGDKAKEYLDYIIRQHPGMSDPDPFLYLALTLHGQQDWDGAIQAYKSFLRVAGSGHPKYEFAADNIRRCVQAMQIAENADVALVENLGNRVNTPGDEFAPLPSLNHSDRIYFSAAREGCVGGLRNDAGYEDLEKGHWCSDMYAAKLNPGGWEYETTLGGLLNTSRFEQALGFGKDGGILYFFRGFTLYGGDVFADTAGRKDEYATAPPVFSSPMHPELGDCAPYMFNDTILLFASRRAGGLGGLDLYWSHLSGGAWAEPQNLGPKVNSAYDDSEPLLARDGRTLYFSSNRLESMGGLDIFKTVFNDVQLAWTPPVNMGIPVNSPGDDSGFRLSDDGRNAFFASDRLDSYGQRDLYIAYFKESVPEQGDPRIPAYFADVRPVAEQPDAGKLKEIRIPALLYDNDRDLLSADNVKVIDDLSEQLRNNPSGTLLITVHTDESGPVKFDLYNGIKRAEIMAKAFSERGVLPSRIVLLSCGPTYPLALNVLDAAPNPIGRRLNRRVELRLLSFDNNLPLHVILEKPVISPVMRAAGSDNFDKQLEGLCYKVEVSVTRQLLNSDILGMFSDLMIESKPGEEGYHYTAGWSRQYSEAAPLRAELQKQGFKDAVVVAYLNGLRISKAEAVALVKKYPDLLNYVRG